MTHEKCDLIRNLNCNIRKKFKITQSKKIVIKLKKVSWKLKLIEKKLFNVFYSVIFNLFSTLITCIRFLYSKHCVRQICLVFIFSINSFIPLHCSGLAVKYKTRYVEYDLNYPHHTKIIIFNILMKKTNYIFLIFIMSVDCVCSKMDIFICHIIMT